MTQPFQSEHPAGDLAERVGQLEDQVQVLAQAVRALAQGLEQPPTSEPPEVSERAARGARLAHELLLTREL